MSSMSYLKQKFFDTCLSQGFVEDVAINDLDEWVEFSRAYLDNNLIESH